MTKKYIQGFFKPQYPEKYKGDPSNIVYRSSWECRFMSFLDRHKDVILWCSEELVIPYLSPLDGKWHRYFPDFWVKKRSPDGTIDIHIIEIKPHKQTLEPKPQKNVTKKYLHEVQTWAVNSSKWTATQQVCNRNGWKFTIMTEKELGILNG